MEVRRSMKRVVVNIDSLVLKGFRYEDRHIIGAAVQDEITRVLSAPEAAQRIAEAGNVPRMSIRDVQVGANTKPQQVGSATGRAVGQGLIK
jgi:hypothetical protein